MINFLTVHAHINSRSNSEKFPNVTLSELQRSSSFHEALCIEMKAGSMTDRQIRWCIEKAYSALYFISSFVWRLSNVIVWDLFCLIFTLTFEKNGQTKEQNMPKRPDQLMLWSLCMGYVMKKPIPFKWSSRATWQYIISNTDANI
jgi:hypothetical protein